MSHIARMTARVTDLDAWKEACRAAGATFVEGATSHRTYYGRTSTAPAYSPGGRCAHAVQFAGADYELGLYERPGVPGFDLVFDTWGPGSKVAQAMPQLLDEYQFNVSAGQLRAEGYMVEREHVGEGARRRLRLRATA